MKTDLIIAESKLLRKYLNYIGEGARNNEVYSLVMELLSLHPEFVGAVLHVPAGRREVWRNHRSFIDQGLWDAKARSTCSCSIQAYSSD